MGIAHYAIQKRSRTSSRHPQKSKGKKQLSHPGRSVRTRRASLARRTIQTHVLPVLRQQSQLWSAAVTAQSRGVKCNPELAQSFIGSGSFKPQWHPILVADGTGSHAGVVIPYPNCRRIVVYTEISGATCCDAVTPNGRPGSFRTAGDTPPRPLQGHIVFAFRRLFVYAAKRFRASAVHFALGIKTFPKSP